MISDEQIQNVRNLQQQKGSSCILSFARAIEKAVLESLGSDDAVAAVVQVMPNGYSHLSRIDITNLPQGFYNLYLHPPQPVVVPEGFKLVRIEPASSMIDAEAALHLWSQLLSQSTAEKE